MSVDKNVGYSSGGEMDSERGNAAITAAAGAQTLAGSPPLTRLVYSSYASLGVACGGYSDW